MKRGLRFVHGGEKELVEKLGRKDPCPCGSGKSFQALLPQLRPVSTAQSARIIGATEGWCRRQQDLPDTGQPNGWPAWSRMPVRIMSPSSPTRNSPKAAL